MFHDSNLSSSTIASGREMLALAEAETPGIAQRSQFLAVILAAERLRAILDDGKSISPGEFEDRCHVAGDAEDMNDENRLGPGADEAFDSVRIDRMRSVDIREDRLRPRLQDRECGRDEGVRRTDDFVARPDSEGIERGMQRRCAVGRTDGVRASAVFREFDFELPAGTPGPVVDLARSEYFRNLLDGFRCELGSLRQWFGAHLLAAVDCQLHQKSFFLLLARCVRVASGPPVLRKV